MRIVKRSALERNTAIYGSPRRRCSTVFVRQRAERNVVRTTLDGRVNPTTFTTASSTRFSHANERLSRFSTVTRSRASPPPVNYVERRGKCRVAGPIYRSIDRSFAVSFNGRFVDVVGGEERCLPITGAELRNQRWFLSRG